MIRKVRSLKEELNALAKAWVDRLPERAPRTLRDDLQAGLADLQHQVMLFEGERAERYVPPARPSVGYVYIGPERVVTANFGPEHLRGQGMLAAAYGRLDSDASLREFHRGTLSTIAAALGVPEVILGARNSPPSEGLLITPDPPDTTDRTVFATGRQTGKSNWSRLDAERLVREQRQYGKTVTFAREYGCHNATLVDALGSHPDRLTVSMIRRAPGWPVREDIYSFHEYTGQFVDAEARVTRRRQQYQMADNRFTVVIPPTGDVYGRPLLADLLPRTQEIMRAGAEAHEALLRSGVSIRLDADTPNRNGDRYRLPFNAFETLRPPPRVQPYASTIPRRAVNEEPFVPIVPTAADITVAMLPAREPSPFVGVDLALPWDAVTEPQEEADAGREQRMRLEEMAQQIADTAGRVVGSKGVEPDWYGPLKKLEVD